MRLHHVTGLFYSTDLKEGIIAAMSNQYNYMRSALLTRNFELERLVTSLLLLVDATSDGLSSALKAHNSSLQQISDTSTTLTAVRKQLVTELKKRQNKKKTTGQKKGRQAKIRAECPKTISAIGTGSHWLWNSTTGVYMVESVNPSEYRPAYIMSGSGPSDLLMEFDLREDVNYGIVSRYFSLPFMCIGTGHAVYRRHFYCHKMGTNQIVKYHLKRMDIIAELSLPGATYGNVFPYTSGENSDVDLAVDEYGKLTLYSEVDLTVDEYGKLTLYSEVDLTVDEYVDEYGKLTLYSGVNVTVDEYGKLKLYSEVDLTVDEYGKLKLYSEVDLTVEQYGLWAIYATESSAGKMVISKIDHKTMEIEKTWTTSYPKTHVGNAFMLCGTLFATNSHRDTPTFIKYTFNTDKSSEKILERGELTFPNFAPLGPIVYGEQGRVNKSANSVSLTYDFRTSELHSWSNGRIERFPIYFLEE
ncbi:hypothetical protein Btru_019197 [Bulinus truncatus]|nr:hypothetical protein Btru_019197 [Bulinus truncatus]